MNVIVYTDLSSQQPHRQVGVDRVIASGSLVNGMVRALALIWQEMWI